MVAQLPQGFSAYPELLTLPPRVKNVETSLSDNWKEHNTFKTNFSQTNKRLFDFQVAINDIYFRVTGLEGRQVAPGGGGAGLNATQSQDLAWLHANRPNILLTSDVGDVQAQILAFMDQVEFQNKLQSLLSQFIGDSGSVTRFALYQFNQLWWQNLDLGTKVNVKYLRSQLDNFYTDFTYVDTMKSIIYNDRDIGLNALNGKITSVRDQVTTNMATVDKKIADVKATITCLKTAVKGVRDSLNPDAGCFKQAISSFENELQNEWDAITPGINSASDWRRIIRNFMKGMAKCIRDSMANMETCLSDAEKKL